MIAANLIQDAQNHLNFRQRGMEARLARLAAVGVPTDREGMSAWLSDALDSQLEAAGGVYHACTARTSSGVDADLPVLRNVGCRITRVPVQAQLVEAGEVIQSADDEEDAIVAEEGFWNVWYAKVGTGWMAPGTLPLDVAETAEDAVRLVRESLLAGGECFATRAEARVAVEKMLEQRAG